MRTITLKVDGDTSQLDAKTAASMKRLGAAVDAFNRRAPLRQTQSPVGFDIEEIKREFAQIENLTKGQTRFFAMMYRNMLKESEITSRQISSRKSAEVRQFEQQERHKMRIAEISKIGQIQSARDAARASENAKRREYAEFVRLEREKQRASQRNSFFNDFASSTALGSFIGSSAGNIAGNVVTKVASEVAALGKEVFDLGVDAVKTGAEFEKTVNSLTVFAGGAGQAKRELADLNATVRNTTGLRLVDAEAGYRQLRGLGFEAENSRKLIAGLGKTKLLSGADETSVQRVITNLTQLSSGSTRASADIKEMIHAMPVLRKEFALAFNTTDPKKIAKIFDTNADDAIKKLAEQLEKTKGAAGGLDDSWGKLEDSIIEAKRTFSDPIVEPLTTSVKGLTSLIRQNEETWKSWGQTVADIITGLNDSSVEPGTTENIISSVGNSLRSILGTTTYGAAEPVFYLLDYFKSKGKKNRENKTFNYNSTNDLTQSVYGDNSGAAGYLSREGYAQVPVYSSEEFSPFKTGEDIVKQQRQEEKARQDSLAKIDAYNSQVKSIRENAFSLEVAQNQENVEKVFQLTQSNYQKEIAETARFFDRKIDLSDGDAKEVYKLEVEKNNALRELDTKRKIEQINFDRQQNEKRRQLLIESGALMRREVELSYGSRISIIERAIDQERVAVGKGSDELIDLTTRQENIISQKIKDEYALRLQDKSLTDQQIVNLEKQRDLDLVDLAEQNRQRILSIEEKRTAKQIELINRVYEARKNLLDEKRAGATNFFDTLLNGGIGGKDFQKSIDEIAKVRKDFDALNQKRINMESEAAKAQTAYNISKNETQDFSQTQRLLEELEKQNKALTNARVAVDKFKEEFTFTDLYNEYGELSDMLVNKNYNTIESFEAMKKVFAGRGLVAEFTDLQSQLTKAIATRDQRLADGETGSASVIQNEINTLLQQFVTIQTKMKQFSADFDKQTVTGIKKYIEDMNPLEKMRIIDDANVRIWESTRESYQNIIALESEYYKNSTYQAMKRKEALLEYSREIYERELEALMAIDRARLDIANSTEISNNQIQARVLDHLAKQKNYNESIADGIIGTYEAVADRAGSALDELNEKTKGFLSFIIEPAKALQRNLLTKWTSSIVGSVFGAEIADMVSTTGNPIVDEQKKSNRYLEQIAKGVSGGMGGGSVAGLIRPRIAGGSTGSGGGNWLDLLNQVSGGNFGGSSNASPTSSGGGNWVDLINQVSNGGGQSAGSNQTLWDSLKKTFSTGEGGMFAPRKNLLTGEDSQLAGIMGGIGNLASLAGGLIGGRVGGVLSMAGTGASLGASFGPVGAGVGAGIGLLMGLFGGDPKRKVDKKENLPKLQQGFADAFKEFGDLIADVNALRTDPDGALSKGRELRAAIASGFGIQFASSKYRKQSQDLIKQQLGAIDAVPDGLMEQLKVAVEKAKAAGERERRILPEFADGGAVSSFFTKHFAGLVPGAYDRKDDKLIKVSGNEVVLTPKHWQPIVPYLAAAKVPGFADGGINSPSGTSGILAGAPNITVQNNLVLNIFEREDGGFDAYLDSDKGERKVKVVVNKLKLNKEI